MALLTFGTNITQARGSAGGSVYSRNKGGGYMRARVTPLNPHSSHQTAVRANFASNAKLWSGTLTATERAAWTDFAQANPLVNVLGASIIVSGLAMMMKLNQVLLQLGEAVITTPPANLNVEPIPAPSSISVTVAGPLVEGNTLPQAALADTTYYVFAARPLPAGKQPGTSDYRYLARVDPSPGATTIDVSLYYPARFGPFVAGQNVGLLIAQASISTGAVTPGLRFATLAT